MIRDYRDQIMERRHYVEYLKGREQELLSAREGGTAKLSDMPKSREYKDRLADLTHDLERCRLSIIMAECALEGLIDDVERDIKKMHNPIARAIGRERYINCVTWEETQEAIAKANPKHHYTVRHLQRIFADAIKEQIYKNK